MTRPTQVEIENFAKRCSREDAEIFIKFYKTLITAESVAKARKLKVGDSVNFWSRKYGNTVYGSIKQIKSKNVIIESKSGQLWNVSAAVVVLIKAA